MKEQSEVQDVRVDTSISEIDEDWVDLILEAKDMGISVQEIKEFFRKASKE